MKLRNLAPLLGLLITTSFPAYAAVAPAPAMPAGLGSGYTLMRDWQFGENTSLQDMEQQFADRFPYGTSDDNGNPVNGNMSYLRSNGEWQRYRANARTIVTDANGNHYLQLAARLAKGATAIRNGNIESGMMSIIDPLPSPLAHHIRIDVWHSGYGGPGYWSGPGWLVSLGRPDYFTRELDMSEILVPGANNVAGGMNLTMGTHNAHVGYTNGNYQQIAASANLGKLPANQWNIYQLPAGQSYKDWHKTTLEYDGITAVWYVDDKPVRQINFPWLTPDNKDLGPMNFFINLAVGGTWVGYPTSMKDFPYTFNIKRIVIWNFTNAVKVL